MSDKCPLVVAHLFCLQAKIKRLSVENYVKNKDEIEHLRFIRNLSLSVRNKKIISL
jgi:hypothetical protein